MQGTIGFATDARGRPVQTILPGGSAKHFAYNPQSALVTNVAVDPAGNPVMARTYQRNALGNILGQSTELGEFEYAYDLTDQLTNVNISAYTGPLGVATNESFGYDPMGNREEYMRETNTFAYSANSLNQYTSVTFASFAVQIPHDPNGNQLVHVREQSGMLVTNYFSWDVSDRLISLTNSLGDTAEYHYDPFGRRLSKAVNGVTNYFLYANEGLIAEYDGEGNPTRGYGYTPGSLWMNNLVFLKTYTSGTTNYFYAVNDHLGAIQKLIAGNGAVVWSMGQDAFGRAVVSAGSSIINDLRFSSQYYDQESGLHYNTMRYYDPGMGRYLNRDPIFESGGLNLYGFTENNPAIFFDVDGRATSWELTWYLGRIYAGRVLSGMSGGVLGNYLRRHFSVPGRLFKGNDEIRTRVDAKMKEQIAEICAKGVGVHSVAYGWEKFTFGKSPLSFVINEGRIKNKGHGIVRKDESCSSCKRYYLDAHWFYYDEMDWRSFRELVMYGDIRPPASFQDIQDLFYHVIVEGFLGNVLADTIYGAAYSFHSIWPEIRSGCCGR